MQERKVVALRLLIETAQLEKRLRMVVHAERQIGVDLAAMDDERRRLFPALVPAGTLTRLERGNETLRERQARPGAISRRRIVDHRRSGEHVARHGEAVPDAV